MAQTRSSVLITFNDSCPPTPPPSAGGTINACMWSTPTRFPENNSKMGICGPSPRSPPPDMKSCHHSCYSSNQITHLIQRENTSDQGPGAAGLTAEEDVGGRAHQHSGDSDQRAYKAKDPAEHQQDQAEGQYDDHHLVETWKQAPGVSVRGAVVNVFAHWTSGTHREGASLPPTGWTCSP